MPGPASKMDYLPPDLRKRIEDDLVDRGPGQAEFQEVYAKHNLAGQGISYVCFWRWGRRVRRTADSRKRLGSLPISRGEIGENAVLINDLLNEMLQGGERPSTGDVMKLTISINSMIRAQAAVEAARRDAELHEWKRQQRERQEKALEGVAKKRELDPETLKEIREKVFGLA